MPYRAFCEVCNKDVTDEVKIDSKGIHNFHKHPVNISFQLKTSLEVPKLEEKVDSLSNKIEKIERRIESLKTLVTGMLDVLNMINERLEGKGISELTDVIEKIKKES